MFKITNYTYKNPSRKVLEKPKAPPPYAEDVSPNHTFLDPVVLLLTVALSAMT